MTPAEIESLRKRLGDLTQAEAGELIGVKRRTWQDWEAGKFKPSGPALRWLRLLAERPRMARWLRAFFENEP